MSLAAGAGAGSGGRANPPVLPGLPLLELMEADGNDRDEPGAKEEKLDIALRSTRD